MHWKNPRDCGCIVGRIANASLSATRIIAMAIFPRQLHVTLLQKKCLCITYVGTGKGEQDLRACEPAFQNGNSSMSKIQIGRYAPRTDYLSKLWTGSGS